MAMIPEAVGFSVIAGLPPEAGLFGSVVIPFVVAFVGARAAMISGATASTAVLMGPMVHEHGPAYLFAATLVMGITQIGAGLLHLDRVMRLVSRSVLTGFVNALAILIFLAQLPQLVGVPPVTYALIGCGLLIIYGLPRVTQVVPSPLMAVIVLTVVCAAFGIHLRTISELGKLPDALPSFALPHVPLTFGTLALVGPLGLTLAAVGLLESLLTLDVIDDLTGERTSKRWECVGQGIANLTAPLFGGMAGCAMIGQSIVNLSSGGRGRLSTLATSIVLLCILLALRPVLAIIPVAALTAVMIMVSVNTFSWSYLVDLGRSSWQSTAVMVATVATVIATHDLSKGVMVGVVVSCVLFATEAAGQMKVTSGLSADGRVRRYSVAGPMFFASASGLHDAIDLDEQVDRIQVDFSRAWFSRVSALESWEALVSAATRRGRTLEPIGLHNGFIQASSRRIRKHGVLP